MKRLSLVFIALLVVLLTACGTPKTPSATTTSTDTAIPANTIFMTRQGYTPQTLTIHVGDTVTFINKDSVPNWPASAAHPTHTIYPGSGIQKCGTSEQPTIFDACKGLQQGETFIFTFNYAGTWNYHDHLHARNHSTIVVQ